MVFIAQFPLLSLSQKLVKGNKFVQVIVVHLNQLIQKIKIKFPFIGNAYPGAIVNKLPHKLIVLFSS